MFKQEIKLLDGTLKPENNEHYLLENQYTWRVTGEFTGDSTIYIGRIEKPLWWNRPFEVKEFCTLGEDSLYSYNLPYIYRDAGNDFKTGYNMLVNANSVVVGTHIKIDQSWKKDCVTKLKRMSVEVIRQSLTDLGVDMSKVTYVHNDFLYNGKKFLGYESLYKDGVFSEDLIINLKYKPEEELFKRLTGKYALARGITGIIEETGWFTKEDLISNMRYYYAKYLEENIY